MQCVLPNSVWQIALAVLTEIFTLKCFHSRTSLYINYVFFFRILQKLELPRATSEAIAPKATHTVMFEYCFCARNICIRIS